eukprot:1278974-Karenia_brevis.AAC.1
MEESTGQPFSSLSFCLSNDLGPGVLKWACPNPPQWHSSGQTSFCPMIRTIHCYSKARGSRALRVWVK